MKGSLRSSYSYYFYLFELMGKQCLASLFTISLSFFQILVGLPTSLSELHLDGNKITKVTVDSLKGLKHLAK